MNLKHQHKQALIALGIIVIGAIIGLFIVFSKPGAEGEAHGEHAEKDYQEGGGKPAAAASRQGHAPAEAAEQVALTAAQIKAAGIVLATAGPGTVRSVTTMTGEIRFNDDRTAHVVPRLGGVVESVHADLGQKVKKGQVLAVIASVALAEQRSELLTAQKRQALAKTTFAREQQLWQAKISAEQDYLQARQTLQEADIAVQNAEQKLRALGASPHTSGAINTYQLRAPFDGVVVEKHLSLGESVKEDANVMTISDLSTVWADIAVPASTLAAVRVGARATVKAAQFDGSAEGTVTYVGALLGEQTRTAQARVVLANPDAAWRPGLFVTVDMPAEPKPAAIAVPADAILTVENRATVFVEVAGGFAAHTVTLGRSDGATTEVLTGLAAGSRYVAKGAFVLKAELGKSSAEHAH